MRLIDANFTVYAAESEFDEEDASKIRWLISHIPTVNAELVRHGRWKKEKLVMCEPYYVCSECGKLHDQDYNFCNNCGAKMDVRLKR